MEARNKKIKQGGLALGKGNIRSGNIPRLYDIANKKSFIF